MLSNKTQTAILYRAAVYMAWGNSMFVLLSSFINWYKSLPYQSKLPYGLSHFSNNWYWNCFRYIWIGRIVRTVSETLSQFMMYLSVGWSFDRISAGWNMSQRICTNVLNSVVLYFRQSYGSHVSVANVHCRCSLAAQYLSATVFFYMYIVWCKKVFFK